MKVLVTGSVGFLGSNLVERLMSRGYYVIGIDNMKNSIPDQAKRALSGELCSEFHVEDVRDLRSIKRYFNGVDYVFHLAANADVPNSVEDPEYDFSTNVIGTKNVFECVLESGCKRVLFFSSAAVYGEVNDEVSEDEPLNPISPYGASKACGEMIGRAYVNTFGLPLSVVRIFNCYGPKQCHYVMVDLFRKIAKADGGEIEVLGSPDTIRNYCFVGDAVRAFEEIVLCPNANGEVFNIAGSENIKIDIIVDILSDAMCKYYPCTKRRYTGRSWKGDLKFLSGKIDKVKRVVGWEPNIKIRDGIEQLVEDLRARIGEI